MISHMIDYLDALDFSGAYQLMVLAGAILGAAWVMGITTDPANRYVSSRELQFRRVGMVTVQCGFLMSIMFADRQRLLPWPPQVLIALGFNIYLIASLAAAHQRSKICGRCPLMAAANNRSQARMPG